LWPTAANGGVVLSRLLMVAIIAGVSHQSSVVSQLNLGRPTMSLIDLRHRQQEIELQPSCVTVSSGSERWRVPFHVW
jgi:hypothetical protein